MFDRAADDDAATIDHLAVAPPLEVQRGRSACGDIEHTLLANADGALVADALDLVAHRIGQRHAAQFDRAPQAFRRPSTFNWPTLRSSMRWPGSTSSRLP